MGCLSENIIANRLVPGDYVILNKDRQDIGYRVKDIIQTGDEITLKGSHWDLLVHENQKVECLVRSIVRSFRTSYDIMKIEAHYPDFKRIPISIDVPKELSQMERFKINFYCGKIGV